MRPVDLFQFIFGTSMGVRTVDSNNRLCEFGEPKLIGDKTVIVADSDYSYALDEIGINPFYETARDEPTETILLYRTLGAGFTGRLGVLINYILNPKNEKLPKKLLSLRAALGVPVDDKLAKEWQVCLDELKGDVVVGVVFSKTKLTTRISCIPFTLEEGVEAEWPTSIRKKSPAAFLALFKKLLGVENTEALNEKYGFKSRKKCSSKLDALLQTYGELYEAVNEYFIELDDVAEIDHKTAINLAAFRSHIENMEEYTRYMRGIAVPTSNQPRKIVVNQTQKPGGLHLPRVGSTSSDDTGDTVSGSGRLHIPGSNTSMSLSQPSTMQILPPHNGGYSGSIPNLLSPTSTHPPAQALHLGVSPSNLFGDINHANTAVSLESSMARSPLINTMKPQFN